MKEILNRPRRRLGALTRTLVLGLSLGFGFCCCDLSAADWPEWGGRNMRNMYSAEKGLPAALGKIDFKPGTEEIDTKAAKNLKWAVKIGSQSYGHVTVAHGKVFIGTN